jgi:hypothetical protein
VINLAKKELTFTCLGFKNPDGTMSPLSDPPQWAIDRIVKGMISILQPNNYREPK